MKSWLRRRAFEFLKRSQPKPNLVEENRTLRDLIERSTERDNQLAREQDAMERVAELIEARQMAGSGPWRVSQAVLDQTDRLITYASERMRGGGLPLRETVNNIPGATGDIELALQNVEWRREVSLSWLEFSRWGIQQLILISRLHYIKNPWIQRAINVTAAYVFGRGVEVMSEDDDANAVLAEFFESNRKVLGQAALSDLQKRMGYDGQVFFAFFSDRLNTGDVKVRTIDATEIQEIKTDPNDTDQPWLYRRVWTVARFNITTGLTENVARECWYPSIEFESADKPDKIGGIEVQWNVPVLHFKGGSGVGKWHFDVPKAYAALDWAKLGKTWLESCATIRKALAQFALILTTKGGQQALEGAKQQLQTTVGPNESLWDMQPPTVTGGTFASGPGTKLEAFNTRGAGGDPSDCKEYRAMVATVFGIPPTFLGDLETANLATATTLDRPTELTMLEIQERWREVLIAIARFVLTVSQGAAKGRLIEKAKHQIIECPRVTLRNGTPVYKSLSMREAAGQPKNRIIIKANFPAIREGDLPQLVTAISTAMTLGNKSGEVIGIDERTGVALLFEQFGVEDYGDILDKMYPESTYDPDRTKEPEPAPDPKANAAIV